MDDKECTQKLFPFFRGYVLVPNAFFLFNISTSSPLIPLSGIDLSKFDKPLTWIRQNESILAKQMTSSKCIRWLARQRWSRLAPPYCCKAEIFWFLAIETSSSSPIVYSPTEVGAGAAAFGKIVTVYKIQNIIKWLRDCMKLKLWIMREYTHTYIHAYIPSSRSPANLKSKAA